MSFARRSGSSSLFFPSAIALRRRRLVLAAVMLALVGLPSMAIQLAKAAPAEVAGFIDFQYSTPPSGADDVSAVANQSKLWFNGGTWWGYMFSTVSASDHKFRIFKLNMATQAWTATATNGDDRDRSHADVLWTGSKLFVASAHTTGTEVIRVYRYSYTPGPGGTAGTYTLDGGFPKNLTGTEGARYVSIVQEPSSNQVWLAYASSSTIKLVTSTNSGGTWGLPFDLPSAILGDPIAAGAPGATSVTDDKVQLVRAGASSIGVFWSNSNTVGSGFYFAEHLNADADAIWQARETAYVDPASAHQGLNIGDNHISVKFATDGRVIAAVKTDKNNLPTGTTGKSDAPLVAVLERDTGGTWAAPVNVSKVSQGATRPLLVLDAGANQANVFMTLPVAGGNIMRRTASLTTLGFGSPSVGTAFIDSTTHTTINDATGPAHTTTAESGVIVLATNIPTRTYLHGCAGAVCPAVPVANFTATPLTGFSPLSVQFTDTSTGTPATWSWDFGDGSAPAAVQNPSHSYAPGTYTVSLTVTNALGTDIETKTDYITVDEPPGGQFVPLAPTRVLDSRPGTPFVHGTPRAFAVTNGTTIPNDAVAVSGNLTVVGQTRGGFVSLGPTISDNPSSSTINFPAGDDRANGVIVPLNTADGSLQAVFRGSPPGGSTDLIFDVTGYFLNDATKDDFFALGTPFRIIDTRRPADGAARVPTGSPRTFDVAGVASSGVPADATAVTGNLTITGQTAKGFASIGPVADATPDTSNINFPLGDTRANNVTVQLSGAGELSFTFVGKPGSSTHFIFDVTGYFKNDSAGAEYFPLAPTRILDSRINLGVTGAFTNNNPRSFVVEGGGVVPTNVSAVTGNLTVTGQTSGGFATIAPSLSVPPDPPFSNLNFPVGDNRANGATVGTNATDGKLALNFRGTPGRSAHFLFDVSGYFK